ncbi:MAG: hypothetical protein ACE37K_11910 [Planctomycetota bacterium]
MTCPPPTKTTLTVALLSLLPACALSGPGTVGSDRFDYVSAIARSQDQQLLLNIVRARYAESPMVVDVGSVVSGYEFGGKGGATWANVGLSSDTLELGVEGRWLEQPTITYKPVTGRQFDRVLVTPVPPGAVLYFMQAGWPAQMVLRMAVDSVNDHRNGTFLAGRGPAGDAIFDRMIDVLTQRLHTGSLGLRLERDEDGAYTTTMALLDERIPPEDRQQGAQLRESLGIAPDQNAFPIVYGPADGNPATINVLTRPLLQVLNELSAGVQLPDDDRDRALAVDTSRDQRPPIRIASGSSRPGERAFVAVQYRGHWFWIDDDDLESRQAFGLLLVLFHVMAGGDAGFGPSQTIPT